MPCDRETDHHTLYFNKSPFVGPFAGLMKFTEEMPPDFRRWEYSFPANERAQAEPGYPYE